MDSSSTVRVAELTGLLQPVGLQAYAGDLADQGYDKAMLLGMPEDLLRGACTEVGMDVAQADDLMLLRNIAELADLLQPIGLQAYARKLADEGYDKATLLGVPEDLLRETCKEVGMKLAQRDRLILLRRASAVPADAPPDSASNPAAQAAAPPAAAAAASVPGPPLRASTTQLEVGMLADNLREIFASAAPREALVESARRRMDAFALARAQVDALVKKNPFWAESLQSVFKAYKEAYIKDVELVCTARTKAKHIRAVALDLAEAVAAGDTIVAGAHLATFFDFADDMCKTTKARKQEMCDLQRRVARTAREYKWQANGCKVLAVTAGAGSVLSGTGSAVSGASGLVSLAMFHPSFSLALLAGCVVLGGASYLLHHGSVAASHSQAKCEDMKLGAGVLEEAMEQQEAFWNGIKVNAQTARETLQALKSASPAARNLIAEVLRNNSAALKDLTDSMDHYLVYMQERASTVLSAQFRINSLVGEDQYRRIKALVDTEEQLRSSADAHTGNHAV